MNQISKANALVEAGSIENVQYVSNNIDEIIKQLTVNKQHIEIFCAFYLKLLDRLFGEDVTATATDVSTASTWKKSNIGGWFKDLKNRNLDERRSNDDFTSRYNIYYRSLGSSVGKLLKHFAPNSTMFDILSTVAGGCELNISLLPYKTQLFLNDHPSYACLRSENHPRICKLLLNANSLSANQVGQLTTVHAC